MSKFTAQKTSLKDKQEASEASMVNFDPDDHLAIDPSLLQELQDKGLAHRWINAKKNKDNYGFDSRGWTPYKRDSKPTPGFEAFGNTDAENYTRRGDLVLAAQSTFIAEKRKAKIADRNRRLSGDHQKSAAQSLREAMGGKAKIFVGDEENS